MITINEMRFLEVFGLIFEAHQQNTGIFARHTARAVGPQHIFRPKAVASGSKDHLYWLALVAFSDRRTNSTTLYRNFAHMFDRNPTLFRRGKYPSLRRMTKLFRAYRIAVPVGEISRFIERKRHLDELFEGDPLKIYEGSEDIASLMKKMRKIARENGIKILFPGAKEKISSLLAMFLREFVDLKFDDVVPIDVWVQAIAASTGSLVGEGFIKSSPLEKLLRLPMTRLFKKHRGVDGAANATWILGKFGCTNCSRTDMSKLCPIYHLCKGPFVRMRHPGSGKHFGAIEMPPKHKSKYSHGMH